MESHAVSGSKRPRIIIIGTVIGAMVTLYLVQIFALQVLEKAHFQSRATLFSQRAVPIPSVRGEIYDRNQDVPLASSHSAYTVRLVPGDVPAGRVPELLAKLALILHLDPDAVGKLVPPSVYSQFSPITLSGIVEYSSLQRLAERSSEFPGVRWDEVSVRDYHDVGSLASVLGYVGDITQEELQVLYNSGYDARSVVGKTGLEKQYDLLLRGKDGTRYQTVDALGRQQAGGQEVPPIPGKSLVLTIDRADQTLAEQALGDRIGSVVILKPSTGEILAMVSHPTFDPNAFLGPDASQTFTTLLADTRYPFLNRAIQAVYPPGSIFKIIMSAAVLGDGVIDPARKIFSGPEYVLGDRSFKEHDPHGLGWVDLERAVELSSDIYFYTVGVEYLGIDRISRYARDFGLDKLTGVDLPGEVSGQIPDAAWKQSRLHSPWVGGDTVNTSIGQGYVQVTPLQMADVVANVVNEGKVFRPHLLKKVIDRGTGAVDEPVPDLLFQSNVPAKAYGPLQAAMRGVIVNGTAAAVVTTKAVEIAGKTGTAEDGEKGSANHSWFVAYAPFDDPDPDHKIVVVVQVERSNKWEWWAPKAANLIFQGIFAHQTYDEALHTIRLATPWWG